MTNPHEATRDMLAGLTLPAGTHTRLLTTRDERTTETAAKVVVWSDLPYADCPGCGQAITQDTAGNCPLYLDGGASPGPELQELDAAHHCSEWLDPITASVPGDGADATEDQVLTAAREVAEQLAQARHEQRAEVERALRGMLAEALAQLAAGRPAEQVADGSDSEPGVYHDGTEWVAWRYNPDGSGDIITVTADSLT